MSERDKCTSYSSDALVFQRHLTSLDVEFQTFLFFAETIICSVLLAIFFPSSIHVVLMLAHVFSAFVKLRFVNHDRFFMR